LQKVRFNENLHVDIQINPASLTLQIPPLALQMLVDNCIKHNIISENHPLNIRISDDEKTITVKNNFQPKQNTESTGQGLKNIEGRYRFIGGESIKIDSNEKYFSVTIPLITK
jgi:LytS/YehU family sensor histidine kinase